MMMIRPRMVPISHLIAILLFLQYVFVAVSAAARSDDDNQGHADDNHPRCTSNYSADGNTCSATAPTSCGLYLAKSSIPNSGLGLFSGKSHEYGAVLSPPEIVHQLILTGTKDTHANPEYYKTLVRSYTWDSYVSGGGFESYYVESLIPGIGMAANCFTSLVNARSMMGPSIDVAGRVDSRNATGPGAGAFSAYHGMRYVAETPIEAGDEIFADYGDGYFRNRVDVYGNIPLKPEFEKADTMKIEDLPLASKLGTARHFLYGENPRSIEWLEANGYCTDTLDVHNSDIAHAGRGAFATRPFAAGERILPLPLLQIPRKALDILGQKDKLIGRQLLLNYCFGHPKSSLLLMPYSSTGGFINHASEASANAKVVWATSKEDPSDFHRDEWMLQPPSALFELERAGLMMHVVALRDIAEGEEVTIDYGQDWVDAWNEHYKEWDEKDAQITAAELNVSQDIFRTIFEDPYPPGVATACHYRFGGTEDERRAKYNPNNEIKEPLDKSMVATIEANAPIWKDLGGRVTMSGDHFRPCTIIARHGNSDSVRYTVKVENREKHLDWDKIPNEYQHFVQSVPSRAILFVDKAHTSHQQYENAFRHEIGFPNADEMWPAAWRDLE